MASDVDTPNIFWGAGQNKLSPLKEFCAPGKYGFIARFRKKRVFVCLFNTKKIFFLGSRDKISVVTPKKKDPPPSF